MNASGAGTRLRALGLRRIGGGAHSGSPKNLRGDFIGSPSRARLSGGPLSCAAAAFACMPWVLGGAAALRRALVVVLVFVFLIPLAHAQDLPLVAALSTQEVRITTAFTGEAIMVFGSTDQPIGPGGDEIIVVARGPTQPLVVRRKVKALLFWVNGPSARFAEIPSFYAIAGTRPVWQLLPEDTRQQNSLGLDALPLASTGARSPTFRAALLELKKESGLWLEEAAPVEIRGARLFNVELPLPATVPTGDYQVEVLLVRSRRIAARQELDFRVERVGTADRIATIARGDAFLYGIVCILAASLAGWLGAVLFRRD
jgi:uncharacterized protein (TIGR02186 family)